MKSKRLLSIRAALEWAFKNECAQLSLPEREDPEERGFGFGAEYVLLQRMRLGGVRIDTSHGRSYPHEDAEALAAAVTNISDGMGGFRMALTLHHCALTGLTPDCRLGEVPKMHPRVWGRRNQLGQMAKTEIVRQYVRIDRRPHPKNPRKKITYRTNVEEHWCPCVWKPTFQEIETARLDYQKWRNALVDLHDLFVTPGLLATIEINDDLPPDRPWLGSR